MNDLIVGNLGLVHFVIKKMNISNLNEYDDFYQVGVIGLINAAKTYNDKLNKSFSTYAYICIKNEILRYLKKNEKNVYHWKILYMMKLKLSILCQIMILVLLKTSFLKKNKMK